MGYFYALFEVAPFYLTASAEHKDMDVALSRGWITQESMLVKIQKPVLQGWVRRMLAGIIGKGAFEYDGRNKLTSRVGNEFMMNLFKFVGRRCRLVEVTKLMLAWWKHPESVKARVQRVMDAANVGLAEKAGSEMMYFVSEGNPQNNPLPKPTAVPESLVAA